MIDVAFLFLVFSDFDQNSWADLCVCVGRN